jgi:hypothetical protein
VPVIGEVPNPIAGMTAPCDEKAGVEDVMRRMSEFVDGIVSVMLARRPKKDTATLVSRRPLP